LETFFGDFFTIIINQVFKIIIFICIMSINDETLMDALENESNTSIIKLTSKKIKEHKNNILQSLQLDRETLKLYHKKLKHYRYCSDVNDFQSGQFIRWINLKDPDNIRLTNGAFLVDVIFEKNKLHLQCKNSSFKVFQVKYDEVIVFQKISDQENVILSVLDYLEK